MSVPTTILTAGGGPVAITTTAEANGLLVNLNNTIPNQELFVGVSGSNFTSVVLAIRGKPSGGSSFYPFPVYNQTANTVPATSASITLTNSTAVGFRLSTVGLDAVEIYVVSGTLTAALQVEASLVTASANAPTIVSVGTTNGSFSGTLAVTGATTLSDTLTVSGATTLSSTLAVTGASTLTGAATLSSTLAVTGAASFSSSVLSASPSAGIGYATGAGGAVTQGSSRTTGVTLSKITGAITLVSAAGSATPFTFTVTNTTVAALDTIIVSQKSGTDAYSAVVSAVAAGSFKLTITDLTGTTTEQPVFNFAVIKAVAS